MDRADLSWMFAALSTTNEAILRARSEAELYQRVCDGTVSGGAFLGSTAYLVNDGGLLHRVAVAGAGFLTMFPATVDATQESHGLVATAYRTRRVVVTSDYVNDRRVRRFR